MQNYNFILVLGGFIPTLVLKHEVVHSRFHRAIKRGEIEDVTTRLRNSSAEVFKDYANVGVYDATKREFLNSEISFHR